MSCIIKFIPPSPLSIDLCEFKDLQIKLVKINEILADPENPNNDSLVLVETKSLRDSRSKNVVSLISRFHIF